MWLYFSLGVTLGATAAVSPGPFQAFLLSQTLQLGWRRAIWSALAPIISDGPIIALVLFLLTQLPPRFLSTVQLLGGLFILYLAYGAFQVFRSDEAVLQPTTTSQTSLLKAALVNGLNPNPYVFWGTVAGPLLIQGWREAPLWGGSFLAGFYGAIVGGFAALVLLFAFAGQLGPRVTRGLNGLSALALLLFGGYQLWLGLQGWLV